MRHRMLRSLAVLGLLTAATGITTGVAAADTTWSPPTAPTPATPAPAPADTTWTTPADTTWTTRPLDTTW